MGYLTATQAYDPAENTRDTTPEFTTEKSSRKLKEVPIYYSNIVGSSIVDAITGAKYPWRVGSTDEQRFFRTLSTVVPHYLKRKNDSDIYNMRSANKAFYEDPYAYMRHNDIDLSDEFIKEWYTNKNTLYPGQFVYHN